MLKSTYTLHEPFKSQWEALKSAIPNSNVKSPAEPFIELLKTLEKFADRQLAYIARRDNGSQDMSWAYTHTLQQVGADWDVISRAMNQRLNSKFIKRLKQADKLCEALLQPAQEAGLCSKGVRVYTYFNKSDLSRVMPYANIALIGIPWTSLMNDRDLLAVAHELGHFIYWDERLDGKAPRYIDSKNRDDLPLHLKTKQFQEGGINEYKQKFAGWIEETCADIIGCLLARHFIAKSFIDLSLDRNKDNELTQDDGEHPSPFVRPDIYIHVLKKLDSRNNTDNWTDALSTEWLDAIRKRLAGRPSVLDERDGVWAELKPKVEKLYNECSVNKSLETKFVPQAGTEHGPGAQSQQETDTEILYKQWKNKVPRDNSAKTVTSPAELYPYDFASEDGWKKWQNNLFNLYDGIMDTNPNCDTCRVAKEIEITVYAGGWTEGPCCIK
jgi:hypothetical protein